MSNPEQHDPKSNRQEGFDQVSCSFSEDLIEIYHDHFLNIQGLKDDDFKSVKRNGDPRDENNIRSLGRAIRREYEKYLPKSSPNVTLDDFRVSTTLAPHRARIPLAEHESWEPSHHDVYAVVSILESLGGTIGGGYVLPTSCGLERFLSPVASFVIAPVAEGGEFPQNMGSDEISAQASLTYLAYRESRARLRPFENEESNIIQDEIIMALSGLLGSESPDRELIKERFSTVCCSSDRYVIQLDGKGEEFDLDIHLHSGDQSVVVATPVELLMTFRGMR